MLWAPPFVALRVLAPVLRRKLKAHKRIVQTGGLRALVLPKVRIFPSNVENFQNNIQCKSHLKFQPN